MTTVFDLADYQQSNAIRAALGCKRIAIVGLSNNPARASNDVVRYMLDAGDGYEVIPVNPNESSIFGRPCYPNPVSYTHLTLPTNREV